MNYSFGFFDGKVLVGFCGVLVEFVVVFKKIELMVGDVGNFVGVMFFGDKDVFLFDMYVFFIV